MHDHDKKWHSEMIASLPYKYRITAISGYADAYEAAYDSEPALHKKTNAARFAANTRLREFCAKVAESANQDA